MTMVPIARAEPIQSLTGLRGVAVWTVVWAHTVGAFADPVSQPYLVDTARIGEFGMTLFFVLSGFVIHENYRTTVDLRRLSGVTSFLVARFARLFPLYILVLAQATRDPLPFQKTAFLDTWPYFIFLIQSWLPFTYHDQLLYLLFVGVAWSISTEVFLYLIYIPLSPLLSSLSRSATLRAITVLILIVTIVRLANGAGLWNGVTNDYWAFYLSPYCRLPEFMLGVLIAQLRSTGYSTAPAMAKALIIGSLAWSSVLMALSYTPGVGDVFRNMEQSWGFAPAAGGFILVLSTYRGWEARAAEARWLVTLGDASYSTYLLHGYVMWLFMRWDVLGLKAFGVFAVATVAWPMLAIISIASYRLYERPMRNLIRSITLHPRRAKTGIVDGTA